MGDMIRVPTLDAAGDFDAYCATPEDKPHAAIIVIQEVFGVNAGIRARCDRYAAAGYVALAPDLFWRQQPGVQLEADTPGDIQKGIDLLMAMDGDLAVSDIEATIREGRDRAGGRKVGVVGFCMGGRFAYLAATRTGSDASVGYYGAGIDQALGESHAIANPLMLHFAEQDHFIDAAARQKVSDALDANPHVSIHLYPGVDHGFATESGQRRDDAAATLADRRTADFFAQHLG